MGEHHIYDGGSNIPRFSAGGEVMHANARGSVELDDSAFAIPGLGDVRRDEVDTADIKADYPRGAFADESDLGMLLACNVTCFAASGEIRALAEKNHFTRGRN